MAASYVKFIESAGGRVVPIHYEAPQHQLKEIFSSINGVLFPGGSTNLANTTQYASTARYLFDLAKQANQKGDVFPVWGTCLGFELVGMLVAEEDSVNCVGCFHAYSLPLPLNLTAKAKTSKMFGSLDSDLFKAANTLNITMNMHQSGIKPQEFREGSKLDGFFNVISTNYDANGLEFVSSMEGKEFPVFATQWHPEKNNFEWTRSIPTPHSMSAVRLSQAMANVFLSAARQSSHTFPDSKAEYDALIYNKNPVRGTYYDQMYVWGRGGDNNISTNEFLLNASEHS